MVGGAFCFSSFVGLWFYPLGCLSCERWFLRFVGGVGLGPFDWWFLFFFFCFFLLVWFFVFFCFFFFLFSLCPCPFHVLPFEGRLIVVVVRLLFSSVRRFFEVLVRTWRRFFSSMSYGECPPPSIRIPSDPTFRAHYPPFYFFTWPRRVPKRPPQFLALRPPRKLPYNRYSGSRFPFRMAVRFIKWMPGSLRGDPPPEDSNDFLSSTVFDFLFLTISFYDLQSFFRVFPNVAPPPLGDRTRRTLSSALIGSLRFFPEVFFPPLFPAPFFSICHPPASVCPGTVTLGQGVSRFPMGSSQVFQI